MQYGGIEAGGTKFVCAIGDQFGNLHDRIEFPTATPEETIPHVIDYFNRYQVDAIGIGSFGPIDVNPDSSTYGNVTTTPKPGWNHYPLLSTIQNYFKVPIGFNTDVNGAALAEVTLGAAKGLDSCLYITVGTGIGAGAVVGNQLLQGLSHPEMGHIVVRRHPTDTYRGKCPYHYDCLEGLAAGPALEERWGKPANMLTDKMEVWEMEAYYLAQAISQYILILSPEKVILGGGVSKQKQIFPLIHKQVQKTLNGYVSMGELDSEIDNYIVSAGLVDDAGIIGALLLADRAFYNQRK